PPERGADAGAEVRHGPEGLAPQGRGRGRHIAPVAARGHQAGRCGRGAAGRRGGAEREAGGERAMTLGSVWRLLRTSAEDWINDRATELAAALSFYMIFAMAPMVTLVVAIAGFVLGERAARGELEAQIS